MFRQNRQKYFFWVVTSILFLFHTPVVKAGSFQNFTCGVNQSPRAVIVGVHEGVVGEELVFDGSHSADPDGNIVSYEWDFGDGTQAQGSISRKVFYEVGEYTVTLRVRDNCGNLHQQTQIVSRSGSKIPLL